MMMLRRHGLWSLLVCVGVGLLALAPRLGIAGDGAPAKIQIKVPQGDATVTIDNVETKSTGVSREYTTRKIPPGKDVTLTISVKWIPNNYTEIVRTRQVKVKAGDTITEDFTVRKTDAEEKIRVRFVPTPEDVVDEMLKLAKATNKDYVADLGCGDGVMVIRALASGRAAKAYACDIEPELAERTKSNAKKAGVADKLKVEVRDILTLTEKDVADLDVVMLYMGDDLNLRLRPLLQKALRPGARVVSHRFRMGDWQPTKTITYRAKDGWEYELHLWVIGDDKK